jgi:hypothetical protein
MRQVGGPIVSCCRCRQKKSAVVNIFIPSEQFVHTVCERNIVFRGAWRLDDGKRPYTFTPSHQSWCHSWYALLTCMHREVLLEGFMLWCGARPDWSIRTGSRELALGNAAGLNSHCREGKLAK